MAQQGFEYEENAVKFLKKYGIVPKDFYPAGSSHDRPDLLIQKPHGRERPTGAELKMSPSASGGSLVIKYDLKNHEWSFDQDARDEGEEKSFIRRVAEQSGAFKYINRAWTKIPAKFSLLEGVISKKKMYDHDLKNFRDVRGDIPASSIEHYYNKKATYYLNIGTHGFYLLGPSDPLNLNGQASPQVPRFSNSASAGYRARVQYKGSDNYQFTFELTFSSVAKSPYNIAPIASSGSPTIDASKVNVDCFL